MQGGIAVQTPLFQLITNGLYLLAFYVLLPAAVAYGWIRFAMARTKRDSGYWMSILGFCLTTVSAVLAVGTLLWSSLHGRQAPADSPLLTLYSLGVIISGSGLLSSLLGVAQRNPLQWLAVGTSFGVTCFWLLTVAGK